MLDFNHIGSQCMCTWRKINFDTKGNFKILLLNWRKSAKSTNLQTSENCTEKSSPDKNCTFEQPLSCLVCTKPPQQTSRKKKFILRQIVYQDSNFERKYVNVSSVCVHANMFWMKHYFENEVNFQINVFFCNFMGKYSTL